MKTDKQLFQIFSAVPEWLFHLTGLRSPGSCSLRSLTLKSLQRDADGVVVPDNLNEPLTVVEFQFQREDTIYTRIVMDMAGVQEAHGMRSVQGIILFGSAAHDPRTAPWRAVVRGFVLQDLLDDLQRRQPEHPLTKVFQPLVENDDALLESQAARYYRDLKQCELDERRRDVLLNVFVNWLEQRFRDKGMQEIEAMLLSELPELEETRSGRELLAIGEKRGEKRGERRGVELGLENAVRLTAKERFGALSKEFESQLTRLTKRAKEELLKFVVKAESRKDLDNWLKRHAPK